MNDEEKKKYFDYVMKNYNEATRALNYTNSDLARSNFEKWHNEKMKVEKYDF